MRIAVLSEAEATDNEELAAARTTGRQRAQQGVPLEAVLRAYRLATQVLIHMILEDARTKSSVKLPAFLDISTAIMRVIDRHSEAVAVGYRATEAEILRRDDERQQAVFDALLEGRGRDPAVAEEAAGILGLPAVGPYTVIVSGFEVSPGSGVSVTRDTCAAYMYRTAWRIRAGHEIGIVALGGSSVGRLVAALRGEGTGRTGVSDAFTAIGDVPGAYRMAETALRTVPADSAEVAWIAECLPEAIVLATPALATGMARRALGRVLALPATERDALLSTLSVWYQEGRSASRAATLLYCHRNTVMNRLHRIESLGGASLDDHEYLLACYLGLLSLRLLPALHEDAAATGDTPEAGRR
ncbi:helix-turn-helix domain-containing protein [Streptomycetaceae bacterium NBC_01309]